MATLPPLPDASLTLGRRRLRTLLTPALLVALSVAFAACYLAEAYTLRSAAAARRAVRGRSRDGPGGVGGRGRGAGARRRPLPRRAGRAGRPQRDRCSRASGRPRCRIPFAFRAPGVVRAGAHRGHAAERHRRPMARVQVEIAVTAPQSRPDAVVRRPARAGARHARPCPASSGTASGWRRSPRRRPARPCSRPRFPAAAAARLGEMRVGAIDRGLPGGEGWLRQPPWLASARTVWHARSLHLVVRREPARPSRRYVRLRNHYGA